MNVPLPDEISLTMNPEDGDNAADWYWCIRRGRQVIADGFSTDPQEACALARNALLRALAEWHAEKKEEQGGQGTQG